MPTPIDHESSKKMDLEKQSICRNMFDINSCIIFHEKMTRKKYEVDTYNEEFSTSSSGSDSDEVNEFSIEDQERDNYLVWKFIEASGIRSWSPHPKDMQLWCHPPATDVPQMWIVNTLTCDSQKALCELMGIRYQLLHAGHVGRRLGMHIDELQNVERNALEWLRMNNAPIHFRSLFWCMSQIINSIL